MAVPTKADAAALSVTAVEVFKFDGASVWRETWRRSALVATYSWITRFMNARNVGSGGGT
jgi:hypothetical protein